MLLLEAAVFLCHARDPDRDGAPFRPLPVFVYLKGKCPSSAVMDGNPRFISNLPVSARSTEGGPIGSGCGRKGRAIRG